MSHKKNRGNGKNSSNKNKKSGEKKLRNKNGKGNEVNDCYKMKLEQSEELNPDDFE